MGKITQFLGGLLTVAFLFPALANGQQQSQGLDKDSQKALEQTQHMLTDQAERAKAVQGSKDAQRVDGNVRAVAGSQQNADDVYKLASDVFGNMVKEANGDPVKLQEMIEKAQKNPEAFANKFTPEQKAKLKEISEKTPQKPSTP